MVTMRDPTGNNVTADDPQTAPAASVPNPPTDIWAPAAPEADAEHGMQWWVVGGVAALAAIGAVVIVFRSRRSAVPPAADAQSGD